MYSSLLLLLIASVTASQRQTVLVGYENVVYAHNCSVANENARCTISFFNNITGRLLVTETGTRAITDKIPDTYVSPYLVKYRASARVDCLASER